MPVARPTVHVDLKRILRDEIRGHHAKDMIVLHETISPDRAGIDDIVSPARYLGAHGLGIHGVVDFEGKSGWIYDPTAIVYHAASGQGGVNTRSVGFELVSRIPLEPSPIRLKLWLARRRQLDTVARWCAWLHATEGIPLRYSDATVPGITTHWDVSRSWLGGNGHWDCKPAHLGGHFPVLYVVQKARNIVKASA